MNIPISSSRIFQKPSRIQNQIQIRNNKMIIEKERAPGKHTAEMALRRTGQPYPENTTIKKY